VQGLGYGLDNRGIVGRARGFSLLSQIFFMGTGEFFPGIKRPGLEHNLSAPSIAEATNNSVKLCRQSATLLHGVQAEKFTVLILYSSQNCKSSHEYVKSSYIFLST
jgi:hypothetical protein